MGEINLHDRVRDAIERALAECGVFHSGFVAQVNYVLPSGQDDFAVVTPDRQDVFASVALAENLHEWFRVVRRVAFEEAVYGSMPDDGEDDES